MAISKNQLFEEALHLDEEGRAALVTLLLESLDSETEEGVEEAWAAEIERRLELLDSGKAETISWENIKERLLSNLNDK